MLKSKEELSQLLKKESLKIIANKKKCQELYEYTHSLYNIPKGIISDLISARTEFVDTNEFILFCLQEAFEDVNKEKKTLTTEFFTETEIKTFHSTTYEVDNIKFPLRFKMIQITDDQWVGRIDVKTLMNLRKAQLINYNVNAQRVMTKVVRGDKEYYKITVNNRAVNEIAKSYNDRSFIPNAITLNMSMEEMEEGKADFYYDSENMELVINKLDHFDMTDAYHRYLALCRVADKDPTFDYTMELRIVSWNNTKAQTFIWQEDKRTPIRKIDSASFNMNNAANIIVERVNNNINCNMKGLISRNEGIINFAEMAQLVEWFYIKNNKEKNNGNQNTLQLKAIKEITEDLNVLSDNDIHLIEKHWDYRFLLTAMCVFEYCKENPEYKKNINSIVDEVYKVLAESKDRKLNNKTPRKVLIDMVMGIIQSVVDSNNINN